MYIYRYDDKTGAMSVFRKTEDDFDQIGKFKYDKKTDIYTLNEKKDRTARTRLDNIEKGILSDGMNFMTNDYVINVGGEPDLVGKLDIHTSFHTHLSRFPDSAKLVPSSTPGGDMDYKRGQIANGIKRFIILTTGYPPIPY